MIRIEYIIRMIKNTENTFKVVDRNVTHSFAFHPLCSQGAGGDGRATAKGFELGINNLPLVINFNLSKGTLGYASTTM